VATGPIDDEARAVYDLVLRAQRAALDAVRPGPTGKEVDAVARDLIAAAAHGDEFGHGLGHGVGLEVHEGPTLSKRGDAALKAGNVVSVEPGVYVPGRLGVRIEDLVVITEDVPDVLTPYTKELTDVG
jgi:Xaa-Pro aminopeptidase